MSSPSEQHLSTSPIHYSVTVSNTSEHLLDVQMQVDISAASAPINHITLSLPAWIPGSYMVRDFARNLHSLACADSQISIRRQDKQTWVLARKDGETFTQFEVSYQIYAYDLSVRSAFIDDQYAFFNGTSVFLSIKDFEHLAHSVYLDANVYTESTACPTGLASSLLLKQKSSAHHPRRIFECSDYYD